MMCPILQTPCRHLPKADFFRRNHHFSPATAFFRKNNLLCPSSTSFTPTNSGRCFSEAILKSDFVSTLSNRLTQNEFVYTVQEKLITFHDISDLPWWAVIVISTIAVRTLLVFPLAIRQQRVIAKLSNVQKEMETTVEEKVSKAVAQLAKENHWDEKSSDTHYHCEMHDQRHDLYDKHKCNPSKTLTLVFIQIPVWVTMSGAIYNINSMLPVPDAVATQTYLDMKADSFFIFTDLTVPDGSYLLPLFIVLTNLIIIQLKKISVFPTQNRLQSISVGSWRLSSIASFSFTMLAPKCMTLYWLTSSFVGLLQNIIFVYPKTRKILRIPETDAIKEDPFMHLKNKLKGIYYFFRF